MPMTISSMVSMDVKNWDDFYYFNCIGNNSIALAQKQIFNNAITNIIQVQFPPPAIGGYLVIHWDTCSFKSGSVASTPLGQWTK